MPTAPSSRPAPPGNAHSAEATSAARALAGKLTLDGAVKHLQALEDIARRNGGNRALGTPGYQQSLDYVEDALESAGYAVERHEFTTASWSVGKQEATVEGRALTINALSGSGASRGTITAEAAVVPGVGCADSDYGRTRGAVAVVQRGMCPFGDKYRHAAAAGAQALVVVNNADGELDGTLGLQEASSIPVVSVTKAEGAGLIDGAEMVITVDAQTKKAQSWDLLAETREGDPTAVQMVGAHLDSVPDGPGINDNGTGAAAVLETATALGANAPVKNKVRFAFWGAEEEGLIGSTRYVESLAPADRSKIARYLNFDMLGSHNGGYFTYDGDGSSKLEGGPGPTGSGVIEQVFRNYFADRKVPVDASAFDGRSDYGPFVEQGIPSGGVDTGAEKKKTTAQAQKWGGAAGEAYDIDYHTARDTLAAVNREVYGTALGAVGWSTGYFGAL